MFHPRGESPIHFFSGHVLSFFLLWVGICFLWVAITSSIVNKRFDRTYYNRSLFSQHFLVLNLLLFETLLVLIFTIQKYIKK